MNNISMTLTERTTLIIDGLVDLGLSKNRSAFIREAINWYKKTLQVSELPFLQVKLGQIKRSLSPKEFNKYLELLYKNDN